MQKMKFVEILARLFGFVILCGGIVALGYSAWFLWIREKKPLDCKHAVSFQKWYKDGKEYDVKTGYHPFCMGTESNEKVWVKPTLPLINETKEQFLSRCQYTGERISDTCHAIPPKKDEDRESWIQRCMQNKEGKSGIYTPKRFCEDHFDDYSKRDFPQTTIYTPTKDEYIALCRRRYRDSGHCKNQYKHWENEGKKLLFVRDNFFR